MIFHIFPARNLHLWGIFHGKSSRNLGFGCGIFWDLDPIYGHEWPGVKWFFQPWNLEVPYRTAGSEKIHGLQWWDDTKGFQGHVSVESMQALIRSELSWKMVLPQSRKLIKLGAEQLLSMHLKKFDHLNWNEVTSLWYPSFSGNFRTLKWKCCTFSIHYVVPPMAVPETMQPKLAKPDLHGNRSIGHSTSQPHLFSLGKKKRIKWG